MLDAFISETANRIIKSEFNLFGVAKISIVGSYEINNIFTFKDKAES